MVSPHHHALPRHVNDSMVSQAGQLGVATPNHPHCELAVAPSPTFTLAFS